MRHNTIPKNINPIITVEIVRDLSDGDLSDLCEVTEATIEGGGGFGWTSPPPRQMLERYWFGVLTIPERHLIVARMDGVICGAVQLVEPSRQNQAQIFAADLLACFVSPWARGHNIGHELMKIAENYAVEKGYTVLSLDVRETQTVAIKLFESVGFKKWGEKPNYAIVDGDTITGYFYSKTIAQPLNVTNPRIQNTVLKIANNTDF